MLPDYSYTPEAQHALQENVDMMVNGDAAFSLRITLSIFISDSKVRP